MYKRIIIVPYNKFSGSATRLRELLKGRVQLPVIKVPKTSKKYQPRWTDYVINWGCSTEWDWINLTEKYHNQVAVNKLAFFETMTVHNKMHPNCVVNIPEWTDQQATAAKWVNEGISIVGRKKLNGHSGEGIIIYEGNNAHVQYCPLYVQYKKKRHEYRVHFFNEDGYRVIDVIQKKRKKGFEGVDNKIRNHKNGWIYAREDITEPHDLRTQALNAAFASGLKFGAVDLIWNEKENKCYVLEINTAPGLFETTLKNYADAFVKDIAK